MVFFCDNCTKFEQETQDSGLSNESEAQMECFQS